MHKGPRGTEAVESGHVVTVGTLRAHHPGTAGTQSDTDHIVAVDTSGGGSHGLAVAYPINTQLGLRGPDTSNTSREGLGLGGENDPAYTLQAGHSHTVAFAQNTRDEVRLVGGDGQIAGALAAQPGMKQTTYLAYAIQDVRGLDKKQNGKGWSDEGVSDTVDTHATQGVAHTATHEVAGTFKACAGSGGWSNSIDHAAAGYMALTPPPSAVRRLTPVECERLQGFPDNFTAIPWRKKGAEDCPDGPRYKALGNSMAVPVMRWIGERIRLVDDFVSII